jgi:hypothetical protein
MRSPFQAKLVSDSMFIENLSKWCQYNVTLLQIDIPVNKILFVLILLHDNRNYLPSMRYCSKKSIPEKQSNHSSVTSWRSVLWLEETTELPQFTDKLDHIKSCIKFILQYLRIQTSSDFTGFWIIQDSV